MIGQGHYCKNCKAHWSENCGCSSSVESACSGADARLADKRSNNLINLIIDDINDRCAAQAIAKLELLRSAVSPRSSDGKRLLGWPFAFGFMYGMAFVVGMQIVAHYLVGLVAK